MPPLFPCPTEKLTFREVRSPQEFRQGDVAEAVCDVTSSPVPVVAWFYNNMEIMPENNSESSPKTPRSSTLAVLVDTLHAISVLLMGFHRGHYHKAAYLYASQPYARHRTSCILGYFDVNEHNNN